MQDYDTHLEESQQTDYSRVDTYFGVDIFKLDKRAYWFANLFSIEMGLNVDVSSSFDIEDLKSEINKILVQNYHESLTYISDHFEAKKDFNNPDQNLENLLEAIENKIKEALNN